MTEHETLQWNELRTRFIEPISYGQKFPIFVFPQVKPTNATRFLLHILITMGSFTTEFNMMLNSSIHNCFIYAELFTPGDIQTETKSITSLLKQYVLEQLAFYPMGL
jgi:hypothetical protein